MCMYTYAYLMELLDGTFGAVKEAEAIAAALVHGCAGIEDEDHQHLGCAGS